MKLEERIAIKGKVEQVQPNGEIIYTPQTIATVWASANPISGAEKYDASGDFVYKKYAFKIRYRTDLTEEMTINFYGKEYDIAVIERMFSEDRNKYLYIEATYNK